MKNKTLSKNEARKESVPAFFGEIMDVFNGWEKLKIKMYEDDEK